MRTVLSTCAIVFSVSLFAAGCAQTSLGDLGRDTTPTAQRGYQSGYGVVEGIDVVEPSATSSIGLGTVGGAVVGGILGNQVGSGTGRTAATVAGALGGAAAGNKVVDQRRNNAAPAYDIRVRLEDGTYQTVRQENLGDIRVGNRVRIDNGRVYRR